MNGNDGTAGHCKRSRAVARFWKTPGLTHYKLRGCTAYITWSTRTNGGSRSMSTAVDSALRCPRIRHFWRLTG